MTYELNVCAYKDRTLAANFATATFFTTPTCLILGMTDVNLLFQTNETKLIEINLELIFVTRRHPNGNKNMFPFKNNVI